LFVALLGGEMQNSRRRRWRFLVDGSDRLVADFRSVPKRGVASSGLARLCFCSGASTSRTLVDGRPLAVEDSGINRRAQQHEVPAVSIHPASFPVYCRGGPGVVGSTSG
jgi:hypothetical protein